MIKQWLAKPLWLRVMVGLILGLIFGLILHYGVGDTMGPHIAEVWLRPFGDAFVRLIQMLVIPLIFTTLVAGVIAMGDPKKLGSLGGRAVALYFSTTGFAVALGLIIGSIIKPGKGVSYASASTDSQSAIINRLQTADESSMSLSDKILHIIPTNDKNNMVIELRQSVGAQYWPVNAHFTGNTEEQPIFGTDLFMRGDFESFSLYGTDERTWEVRNAQMELSSLARNGNYALEVTPNNNTEPARLGQKIFMRVLPSDDLSFTGFVKSEGVVTVTGYAQYRPRPMNRYVALEKAPLEKLGEVILESGNWKNFKFDFKPPNKNQRAVRLLLEFNANGSPQSSIVLDDLAVIAWEGKLADGTNVVPNRRTHLFLPENNNDNHLNIVFMTDTNIKK